MEVINNISYIKEGAIDKEQDSSKKVTTEEVSVTAENVKTLLIRIVIYSQQVQTRL